MIGCKWSERKNEWIKNKKLDYVCLEREMISLWCEEKEKEGKASTSSNFTQRKQREQDRLHKNDKEGQDPFSFVWSRGREEGSYKEKEENKWEEMEGLISISETSKREASNRNNESEPRNPSPSFLRDTVTDSFLIKDKESRRTESTCGPQGKTVIHDLTWKSDKSDYKNKNSVLTFFTSHRKLPNLRKGRTICLWTLVGRLED